MTLVVPEKSAVQGAKVSALVREHIAVINKRGVSILEREDDAVLQPCSNLAVSVKDRFHFALSFLIHNA
jgi:hypothetical protein